MKFRMQNTIATLADKLGRFNCESVISYGRIGGFC